MIRAIAAAACLLATTTSAFAEDAVVCEGRFSIVVTDENSISVQLETPHVSLRRAEVQYQGETTFNRVQGLTNELGNRALGKVRAIFDNGTSVFDVYEVEWTKFQDGGQIPVSRSAQSPTGLRFVETLTCSGASS